MKNITIENLEKHLETLEDWYNVARKNHCSILSYQLFQDIMSIKNAIAGMKLRGVL